MHKNHNYTISNTEQVIMNGKNELVNTKAHINRIRESLIASMQSKKNSEASASKEDIEFLLKRL